MYDAARVPSPKDGANGMAQPVVPGSGPGPGPAAGSGGPAQNAVLQAKTEEGQPGTEEEEEEEEPKAEPVLVKKPHREILDHERKRRVELKCMELQEMMEEQGVTHLHYQPDGYEENTDLVGYEDGDYDHHYHSDNRVKRKSSSSPSPRPKKRKKKKSGRRRSRFGSSSPTHREKKKKSGKKHKRDRSASGSRKKRRYRSGSPKNKHKDKNKQKKRSPGETPSRSSQRQGSCCSSRSASLSSARSTSKSPARLNSKHKTDGQKASSTSLSPGTNTPAAWHNGDHTQRSRNGKAGRLNHVEKGHNKLRLLTANSASIQAALLREHKLHSTPGRSQTGQVCAAGEAGSVDGRNTAVGSSDKRRPLFQAPPPLQQGSGTPPEPVGISGMPPTHVGQEEGGVPEQTQPPAAQQLLEQRALILDRDRVGFGVAAVVLMVFCLPCREKDSPNRSDTDSRARRRSRSYSPIRKRRRDSPSFMEARRITSARKRPIPYYRPSPSSSSLDSSPSRSSRSRSRSYSSYSRSRSHSRSHNRSHSRSRSRSWSRSRSQTRSWSRSKSRSRSHHSYYSRSSYDSPGF
ncbi:hypothetical protein FQN60_000255 [Etheostoma spectabile]|uniref:CWF21 domain-containing protein n=1 Tax=Etheostoma spectabile TaxID=54343 RepID=A0A5J5CZ32_9PERO|nr:hypothetical protein FQN60_000255 [Etheostoma spectabile]